MKTKTIISITLLIILLGQSHANNNIWKDEYGPPRQHEWEIVQEATDEFEGSSISETKWDRKHPFFTGNRPTYYWKDNSQVQSGEAILSTTDLAPPNSSNQDYRNGFLRTKKEIKYGYIEIYAKTQRNDATTAFWLYAWRSYGTFEIDVFEIGGKSKGISNILHSNHHYYEGDDSYQTYQNADSLGTSYEHNEDMGAEYHVYGLEWDENWTKIYFDGQLIRGIENIYFHTPMRVQLTTEFHPSWFGTVEKNELPSQFNIKWVRTYKKKGYQEQCSNQQQYRQFQLCQNSCYQGYYADQSKICQKCHFSCSSCNGGWLNDCTSCAQGFRSEYSSQWGKNICKKENRNGNYVPRCPDGQYIDSVGQCRSCHSACRRCFGPSIQECPKCNSPYISDVNTCVLNTPCSQGQVRQRDVCQNNCDSGFHPNHSGICLTCHPTCKTCSGFRDNQCLTCQTGTPQNGICGGVDTSTTPPQNNTNNQGTTNTNTTNTNSNTTNSNQNNTTVQDSQYGPPRKHTWKYLPDYSDEFEGSIVSETKWQRQHPFYKGNKPARYWTHNSKIQNGEAILESTYFPDPDEPSTRYFRNGFLKSQKALKYGYIEIEAKTQDNNALSAFWLYDWEPYGTFEIDVFETGGKTLGKANVMHTNFHYFEGDDSYQNSGNTDSLATSYINNNDLGTEYNVYGFEWDENYLKTYFNGQLVRKTKNNYFHCALNIQLTTEFNFNWMGPVTQQDVPSQFHIKYVRTYQKEGYGEICDNSAQYRQGSLCIDSCNQGYYSDSEKICHKCHFSCSSCTGSWKTDCIECANEYRRQGSSCVKNNPNGLYIPKCNDGQYLDSNGNCQSCNSACQRCTGPSIDECPKCNPNYTSDVNTCTTSAQCSGGQVRQRATCQNNCDQGFHPNHSRICLRCHPTCKTCSGFRDNQCHSCNQGYTLQNGVCVEAPMSQNCNSSQVQQGNICQITCDNGYYPDNQKICQPCQSPCSKCTGPTTNECSDCIYGYYLNSNMCLMNGTCPQGQVKQGQNCQQSCNNGYYSDSQQICQQCYSYCSKCTGPNSNECTDCDNGYYLNQNMCIVNGSCPQGQVKQGQNCQQTCDQNYYSDNNQVCQPCSNHCTRCQGPLDTQCQDCENGYYIYQGQCLENGNCPQGQVKQGLNCQQSCSQSYYPNSDNICMPCYMGCSQCSGPNDNQCSDCKQGYYIYQTMCLQDGTCPQGQVKQGQNCQQSCNDKFYVDSQQICKPCDSACQKCSGPGNSSCTECPQGQNPPINNRCENNNTNNNSTTSPGQQQQPICQDGYYADADHICQPCYYNCKKCTGPYISQCTQCYQNWYLRDNKCYGWDSSQCSYGKYLSSSGSCEWCDSSCENCFGMGPWRCSECLPNSDGTLSQVPPARNNCGGDDGTGGPVQGCPQGQVKQDGICQQSCNTAYYADADNICQKCYCNCKHCTGPYIDQCTDCYQNWYLRDNKCYGFDNQQCLYGQYLSASGSCQWCDSTCENCFGMGPWRCSECPPDIDGNPSLVPPVNNNCGGDDGTGGPTLECQNGQVNQDGICQQSCKTAYYADADNICQKCYYNCKHCTGPHIGQCTDCFENWYLRDNKCYGFSDQCLYGQYKSVSGSCQHCDSSCENCFGLGPWRCSECPPDAQGHPSQVPPINDNCGADDGTGGPVLVCQNGLVKQGETCQSTCDIGYYADADNICQKCYYNCKHCTGSHINQCTDCFENWFLRNNSCYGFDNQHCGYGEYLTVTGVCKHCDDSCENCFGLGPWRCSECPPINGNPQQVPVLNDNCGADDGHGAPVLVCQNGLKKQDDICQQSCNIGYYADADNICQECYYNCKHCSGPYIDQCTDCYEHWHLRDNKCYGFSDECLYGQYKSVSGTCQWCDDSCENCVQNSTTCTQCLDMSVAFNNTCGNSNTQNTTTTQNNLPQNYTQNNTQANPQTHQNSTTTTNNNSQNPTNQVQNATNQNNPQPAQPQSPTQDTNIPTTSTEQQGTQQQVQDEPDTNIIAKRDGNPQLQENSNLSPSYSQILNTSFFNIMIISLVLVVTIY